MKVKGEVTSLPARTNQSVPLLDDPPLGHLQALVLNKLHELRSEACGYNVLKELSEEARVWIDHSQIYGTIRKLLDKELILLAETRAQKGAPPLKIYRLTPAGRSALKATIAHHVALAEYFGDTHRMNVREGLRHRQATEATV